MWWGGGSTGLSLQVPQRPRKGHVHLLVWVLPIAPGASMLQLCKVHPLPWVPLALSLLHLLPSIKETRMGSDANTAHRALLWLDGVGVFVCDIFPDDQISFIVAIDLHITEPE